jgi:hypothetical protein
MARVPSGGNNPRVVLVVDDSGVNSSGMAVMSSPAAADSNWYQLYVQFIVQTNGIINLSVMNLDTSTSGRVVNIDNIQLRPVDSKLVTPPDSDALLQAHVIVDPDRSVANDQWGIPNKWVFVQNGLTVAPVEGAGIFTYTNQSIGPSSVDALGREVVSLNFVDASSQADLVSRGKISVNAALSTTEVFSVSTGLFPVAGHFDIFKYSDPQISGGSRIVQAQNWQHALDGDDVRTTWQWESIEAPQYVVYGQTSTVEVVA